MTLLNEKQPDAQPDTKTLLLIFGLTCVGFNLYYKYDRYYLGESLIEKQVIINDPPEFVEAGKGGTDRYTLSGEGYKCIFWISEGSLSIVKDSDKLEHELKSIRKDETIRLKIRQTDEPYLQDASARPRIIELYKGRQRLINANEVESKDTKWYYINFGVPIAALIVWVIIRLSNLLRSRRSEALS